MWGNINNNSNGSIAILFYAIEILYSANTTVELITFALLPICSYFYKLSAALRENGVNLCVQSYTTSKKHHVRGDFSD